MFGMDEVSILVINVKYVLKHAEHKTWNCKYLGKRTDAQLGWKGYE